MEKLILFTDVHITKPGVDIIGLDPAIRLERALTHAMDHHGDACGVVIMGDLAHRGSRTEYQRLKDILADCPLPVRLMLGNHDRRQGFEAIFSYKGFQHQSFDFGMHRVICLDTLDENAPDTHSGLLCPERMDWLADQLKTERPVILLMHHHLALTGFDGMDSIMLRNADQVGQVLANSGQVKMIINGHIHRTIFTTHQDMPVAMLKGTCHQMPLALGPGSSALSVDEPGAYGVLISTPDQVLLHTEDVFETQPEIIDEIGSHTP